MNMERHQTWTSIIHLSERMRRLAEDRQWRQVAELECERQHMISTFFIDPVEIEDSYIIREGIHKILGIDKEIIAIGKTHRQRLGDKLEQFQHSKKAVHAYKIHSN